MLLVVWSEYADPLWESKCSSYTDRIFVIPADTAGQAIFDAAVALARGETLESDTFYMPTFGVGPDELEAKADEIWTIKYADMLG